MVCRGELPALSRELISKPFFISARSKGFEVTPWKVILPSVSMAGIVAPFPMRNSTTSSCPTEMARSRGVFPSPEVCWISVPLKTNPLVASQSKFSIASNISLYLRDVRTHLSRSISRISPQKRHLMAASWITSAQNGHFFMVPPGPDIRNYLFTETGEFSSGMEGERKYNEGYRVPGTGGAGGTCCFCADFISGHWSSSGFYFW